MFHRVQFLFRGKTGKYDILAVSHRRGYLMDTNEREKLITDAAAEFEAGLRSKAEQFEATHAERKLTVSVIEVLWGESRKLSDEILRRVYTEMTNGSEEKLVQEKNCPQRSRHKRPEQGETGTADTDHPGSFKPEADCLEGAGGRDRGYGATQGGDTAPGRVFTDSRAAVQNEP
jgi:hypothetical protein